MTDKDKEAVNLLLETLETCNVKVIQVIIYELYGAIFFSSEFVFFYFTVFYSDSFRTVVANHFFFHFSAQTS